VLLNQQHLTESILDWPKIRIHGSKSFGTSDAKCSSRTFFFLDIRLVSVRDYNFTFDLAQHFVKFKNVM
jgi:hypothetical protein